jgi:hypothetical protein
MGLLLRLKRIGSHIVLTLITDVTRGDNLAGVSIELPLLGDRYPSFEELSKTIISGGRKFNYAPLADVKSFESAPWKLLLSGVATLLGDLKTYISETKRLVTLIEENTKAGISDPKPANELRRLAMQMRKTGRPDASVAPVKSVSSVSKPTVTVSNRNSLPPSSTVQRNSENYQLITSVLPPKRLFHWTRAEFAESYTQSAEFPLKGNSHEGTAFTTMNAEFRNVPVLYAWTHPVTALALNEREVHGGDLLLLMEIKKDAKAIRLESTRPYPDNRIYPEQELNELRKKFEGVDLILHTYGPKENPVFQEWILLNPRAVTRISVDPFELFPLVKKALQELRDPNHSYTREELFSFVTKTNENENSKLYYDDMEFRNQLADFVEKFYFGNKERLLQILPLFAPKSLGRTCSDLF